jgi:hypothetical protein
MRYSYENTIVVLPKKWTFKNGAKVGMKTGNFDQIPSGDLIAEGFLPITVINNESYNPDTHTRSEPTLTDYADHAELDYTLTPIGLNDIKLAVWERLKRAAREIIVTKWNKEDIDFGLLTGAETTQRNTDITTVKDYAASLKSTLTSGATDTAQKALDIETNATWPTI